MQQAPKPSTDVQQPAQAKVVTTKEGQVIVTVPDVPVPPAPPPATETVISVPPDLPFDPNLMMSQVKDIASMFLLSITVIVLGVSLARAWGRRLERPSVQAIPPDMADRLVRIEQAVDSISLEVERIAEGQRFTTKLLAERAEPVAADRRIANS